MESQSDCMLCNKDISSYMQGLFYRELPDKEYAKVRDDGALSSVGKSIGLLAIA